MKRTVSLFLIVSILMVSCSEDRESYTVKAEDVVEAVYSSVTLEPEDMYMVNSSVSGYLGDVFVEQGDTVAIGDVLFIIRDVSSSSNASNAQLSYEQAKYNLVGGRSVLEDLRIEIDNAKLRRKNDSINLSRSETLYAKGAVTKLELEQSEMTFASSKGAHTSVENRYNRTKRDLQTAVDQARNNVEASTSRSGDARIINKINGIIYAMNKEAGELVSPQESIAIVGSNGRFVIKMLIDETDINRVRRGQKIVINLESFKGKTFEAKITKISPMMDTRTQTFELEGTFINPPSPLYMGLTGEASIIIGEKKNTIAIPRTYLIGRDEVETSEGIKKVKTGLTSLSHVEIISGLKAGDIIYKPTE